MIFEFAVTMFAPTRSFRSLEVGHLKLDLLCSNGVTLLKVLECNGYLNVHVLDIYTISFCLQFKPGEVIT